MSITDLSGNPPDPDCLHCVLAEPIQTFMKTHPDKTLTYLVGGLMQITADLICAMTLPEEQLDVALDAGCLLGRLVSEIGAKT